MTGLSLFAVSVAFGCLALWIFRRTANVIELHRTIQRIQAHFLEFRLYYEEPSLIWRAQKQIVFENGRFLILIARPLLLLTVPMIWMWLQFESVYAYAPLPLGQAAVVTAQFNDPLQNADAEATLEAPAGIAVESDAVRSTVDRQISWRIRPLQPVNGELRISYAGFSVNKSVSAGSRTLCLVPRRVQSFFEFLLHPEEPRLQIGNVRWIEIQYPSTGIRILGIAWPWAAWFILISSLSALVLSRFVRVRL